jgi:hypothetical protein
MKKPAKVAAKKAAAKPALKPKVIQATGTATSGRGERSQSVEQAMVKAAEECFRKGVTDPNKIRAAKIAAREKVLGVK